MNKRNYLNAILLLFILLFTTLTFSACGQKPSASDAKDSVVLIAYQNQPYGSGFAIGKVGKPVQFIVTNYHVIEDAYTHGNSVDVYFSAAANRFMSAEIYWKNEATDIAVLRLPEPTTERKALAVCPMKDVNLDDTFTALGYPTYATTGNDFPKYDTNDITITRGAISKTTRVMETDCYLIDININHGNSGGPLVNSKGEVVGINTFGITTGDATANYAIAIDELILNTNPSVIPLTIAGESNINLILIALIAGGIILCVIIVMLVNLINISGEKSRQHKMTANTEENKDTNLQIMCINGFFADKAFSLKSPLIFGRNDKQCNVIFPVGQPGISSVHCKVEFLNASVYITDLGSTYGTFTNLGKLNANEAVQLTEGMEFYLADKNNLFILKADKSES